MPPGAVQNGRPRTVDEVQLGEVDNHPVRASSDDLDQALVEFRCGAKIHFAGDGHRSRLPNPGHVD